jgi:hypothetical protein
MDDVRLRQVTYAELSGLRHEVFVSESDKTGRCEFLVVRYEGAYKQGSAGRGDALYIVASAEAARKAWWAPCTVLDFRDLRYTWGDEMEWAASIGWDRVTRCHAPLAMIVGDRCRSALKSLLEQRFERFCVDTPEQAFALCCRQEIEWRQQLKQWHER